MHGLEVTLELTTPNQVVPNLGVQMTATVKLRVPLGAVPVDEEIRGPPQRVMVHAAHKLHLRGVGSAERRGKRGHHRVDGARDRLRGFSNARERDQRPERANARCASSPNYSPEGTAERFAHPCRDVLAPPRDRQQQFRRALTPRFVARRALRLVRAMT
jgi:hypothetical protein